MGHYFTYIIKCSDGYYYAGFTDSLDQRIYEHNQGFDKKAYTYRRRPVKLVFHYRFDHPSPAKRFERQIKGWRREKKEALIKGQWDLLPKLSKGYSRK